FAGRRDARQGVEPEGARSREQVEDAGAQDGALQDAEPRLAHPIGGGPHGIARRCLEPAAFEFAGDDADHARPCPPFPIADCGSWIADSKWRVARTIRNPKSAIRNGHALGANDATRASSVVLPCHSSPATRNPPYRGCDTQA